MFFVSARMTRAGRLHSREGVESRWHSINRGCWKNAPDVFPCRMTMKTIIAIMALALVAPARAEDELKLADLPPAVRKTVEMNQDLGTPRRIVMRIVNGRTVYDVEMDRKRAMNVWLRIAEGGILLWRGGVPVRSSK
jgi:hypothetical protein